MQFGASDAKYKIPTSLFVSSPKLSSQRNSQTTATIRFRDISEAAGHVIIHYLFTNTYQCLRPEAPSAHEKQVIEFTTSTQVYAASRTYELAPLEGAARVQMEKLSVGLSLPSIICVVQDTYPKPASDDGWFAQFLKSQTKALLTDMLPHPPIPLKCQDDTTSIALILLESVIDLRSEKAKVTGKQLGASMTQQTSWCNLLVSHTDEALDHWGSESRGESAEGGLSSEAADTPASTIGKEYADDDMAGLVPVADLIPLGHKPCKKCKKCKKMKSRGSQQICNRCDRSTLVQSQAEDIELVD